MPARRSRFAVHLSAAAAFAVVSSAHAQSLASSAADAAGKVWTGAQDVAAYALGLLGVNYKFGGNSPETGLDCSGLVRYVFQEVTGVSLPRTAKEMSGLGSKVTIADLKPGDLVFFNTRRFAFSHVGIYLGDNRFVHAPRRGREVTVASLDQAYWQKHFNGARRLVGELPSLLPSVISPAVAGEFTPGPAIAGDFASIPAAAGSEPSALALELAEPNP